MNTLSVTIAATRVIFFFCHQEENLSYLQDPTLGLYAICQRTLVGIDAFKDKDSKKRIALTEMLGKIFGNCQENTGSVL